MYVYEFSVHVMFIWVFAVAAVQDYKEGTDELNFPKYDFP